MRKFFIISVMIMFVLILSGPSLIAEAKTSSVEVTPSEETVDKEKPGSSGICIDFACTIKPKPPGPPTPVITPVVSGGSLITILANQCKDEMVKYTEWSECNGAFGPFGLMYRTIEPTINGCTPTSEQKVKVIAGCVADFSLGGIQYGTDWMVQ